MPDEPVRIVVPFDGGRRVTGPLTFAQRNTLRWVGNAEDEYSAIIQWAFALPDGITVDDVAAAFGVLLRRHESLRTTFTLTGPEPTQTVAADGELAIESHELTDDEADLDDMTIVDRLVAGLRAQGIDFTAELPLRVAIATRNGRPAVVAAIYSHMAVDYGSMAVIGREFTVLASDPVSREVGPARHQPIDQAALERSSRGQRQAEAALRYWETHLRAAPQSVYPMAAEAGTGMDMCVLHSPAAGIALGHITARTRTSRQVVVLAAVCAALAARTGVDNCVFAAVSSNRFRLRLRDYVGTLSQDGLFALDVREATFDALVAKAAKATLASNTHSIFDAEALWSIIDRIGHARGTAFTRDFSLNDLSGHLGDSLMGTAAADAADGFEIADVLAQTMLTWLDSTPLRGSIICTPGQLQPWLTIAFNVDNRWVGRADTEAVLRGVERLLVAAATDNVPLARIGAVTGIEPVDRGPGWVRVDSCWVELAATRRLVERALGTTCQVTVADAPEPTLVAHLAATPSITTPAAAHAACMALLPDTGWHTAMAPGRYVLCVGAPDDPADPMAWRDLPVLAAGSGRTTEPVAARELTVDR